MSVREEIVAGLHERRSSALIALDFDGTLAPLVPDPSRSRLVDGVRPALDALAAAGARVAVVTGRDAATVVELSGLADLPGLDVEGIYGAQRWHDGRLDSMDEPAEIAHLRDRLPPLVESVDDVWIEDKGLSLVVHARKADDPAAAIEALRADVSALAEELGLEVHPGRDVLELRIPGYDKGGALTRLVERYQPAAVLYVGDDVGDLPAFDVIRQLREDGTPAWAGGITSADVPEVAEHADLALVDPADVAMLLGDIAGLPS
jgi:trehalose 6-phosphate phosphatase